MIAAPVSPTGWRPVPPPSLSALQKHWLLRPGALTAGLRALGRMQLRVLDEYAAGLPRDEAPALRLPPRTPVWVREIVMSVDGVDSVAARSLTPLAASHGVWQGMRRLRTRPLADMLYHDPGILRTPFAVARVRPAMPLHAAALRPLREGEPPAPRPAGRTAAAGVPASMPTGIPTGILVSMPGAASAWPDPLLARRSVFWRHGQPLLVEECFLPMFWARARRA